MKPIHIIAALFLFLIVTKAHETFDIKDFLNVFNLGEKKSFSYQNFTQTFFGANGNDSAQFFESEKKFNIEEFRDTFFSVKETNKKVFDYDTFAKTFMNKNSPDNSTHQTIKPNSQQDNQTLKKQFDFEGFRESFKLDCDSNDCTKKFDYPAFLKELKLTQSNKIFDKVDFLKTFNLNQDQNKKFDQEEFKKTFNLNRSIQETKQFDYNDFFLTFFGKLTRSFDYKRFESVFFGETKNSLQNGGSVLIIDEPTILAAAHQLELFKSIK